MSKKKVPPRPAFTPPVIPNITYEEVVSLAERVGNAVVQDVARDLWTYEPGIYHNTEVNACPLWKGWDRLNRYSPKRFEDANDIFIGIANHQAVAKIIENSIAEHEFVERFTDPDLDVIFHVDVFQRVSENLGRVYEVKTKDHYYNQFDPNIIVANRPEKHSAISPDTRNLNQIVPYMVEGNSKIASLAFIPKSMELPLIVYQIVFDDATWEELPPKVLKTLHRRGGILKIIDEQLRNKADLDLIAIEPSGACKTYCNFRYDKAVHVTNEGRKYECPIKSLPYKDHLVENEELEQIYMILWEYISQRADAKEFNLNRGFYQIQQQLPKLFQLTFAEAIAAIQKVFPSYSEEDCRNYLTVLLELLPNKKKPHIRYLIQLDENLLQLFPLRDNVTRGWPPYIFEKLPYIEESSQGAEKLIGKMRERLAPTDVSQLKDQLLPFQPYDSKGAFGCPRLQAFVNRQEIGIGYDRNPEHIKLYFIDLAIHSTLAYLLGENAGRLYTINFGELQPYFRFLMSSKKVFGQVSPLLILPIHRTEWREIYGSRTVGDPIVITPMEKHAKQAALLSALIQAEAKVKGEEIDPPSVLLMYYPRKPKGDIRLYSIKPEDPALIISEGKAFLQETKTVVSYKGQELEGVARTGRWCHWCLMRSKCPEGLDYIQARTIQQLLTPEELPEDGDYLYRTF